METGPVCNMNWLDHPHVPEIIEGDLGVGSLNPHMANPTSKTYPLDRSGDVGAIEYDPNPRINSLMLHNEGDLIS